MQWASVCGEMHKWSIYREQEILVSVLSVSETSKLTPQMPRLMQRHGRGDENNVIARGYCAVLPFWT